MTIENTDNTKPTSQSSAAASTSSADIKISQDLKSTLELGQVYRAITAVKTSSTGEVTKGVVVKDQFVEMEYPSTIAPGSQVTVRVDATEPSLKLTIIETKPIEHAEGSVSSNAKLIRDLLSRALKANNVGLSNELAEILSNKIHTLESGSTIITSEVLESGAATLEKSLKLSSKDKSFTTVKLLKNLVDEVVQQQELLDQTVKLFLESPKELSRQLSELRPELPAASAESDVRDSFEPKANAQLSRIVDSLGRQYEAISDGKTLEETSKSIRNLLTTVYESDSLGLAKSKLESLMKDLPEGNPKYQDLKKLLQSIDEQLVKVADTDATTTSSKLTKLVSDLEVFSRKSLGQSVEERPIRISITELVSYIKNAMLEQNGSTNADLTIDKQEFAALSNRTTSNSFSSAANLAVLNEQLVEALSNLKTVPLEERQALIEFVIKQIDFMESRAQFAGIISPSGEAQISGSLPEESDSISLVRATLLRLLEISTDKQSTSEQMISGFAKVSLESFDSLFQATAVRQDSILQLLLSIQDSLDSLTGKLALDGSSVSDGGLKTPMLSRDQSRLLNTLESLLDTAVAETAQNSFAESGRLPSAIIEGLMTKSSELLRSLSVTDHPANSQVIEILNQLTDAIATIKSEQYSPQETMQSLQSIREAFTLQNSELRMQEVNLELNSLQNRLVALIHGFHAEMGESNDASKAFVPPRLETLEALQEILGSHLKAQRPGTEMINQINDLIEKITEIKSRGFSKDSAFEQALLSALKLVAGSIEEAANAGIEQQQRALTRFSDVVSRELQKLTSKELGSKSRDKTIKALKDLSSLVRGQEALLSMAPLLESAGDPIFVLFPLLLDGFLSKVEMNFYPEVESDQDEGSNSKKFAGKKKTSINLELPSMGMVSVSFTHNVDEITCELRFEEKSVAAFVEQRIGRLEKTFARMGFVQCEFEISSGPVEKCTPEWVDTYTRKSIIA